MKSFELIGEYFEKSNWKKFSRTITAQSEKLAKEKILCLFGSEHKIPRRRIKVNEVKEVKEAK